MSDLLSRLRASSGYNANNSNVSSPYSNNGSPYHQAQQHQGYHPPTVSAPLVSPPAHTPDPVHPSSVVSPVNPGPSDSKAASLLSLLKSSGNKTSAQPSPLASMRNVAESSRSSSTSHLGPHNAYGQGLNSGGDSKDFLLGLLNGSRKPSVGLQSTPTPPIQAPQPKPSATKQAAQNLANTVEDSPEPSRMRVFGSAEPEVTSFESPKAAQTPSAKFNYVNPFEALSTSRSQTPAAQPPSFKKHSPAPASLAEARLRDLVLPSTELPVSGSTSSDRHVSVSQALNNVADQVDKQVEKALAQAAHPAPAAENIMPKRQKTDQVVDSWESADVDDTADAKDLSAKAKVYTFPMRPFVAIDLKNAASATGLRTDSVMDISRMKKEFDQIDRNLVTATDAHIVYAMGKNGGFRVIRQDSGRDKQVFRSSQERPFNVQISPDSDKAYDYVLAVGVNGTIFWTKVSRTADSLLEDIDLEAEGFMLPAIQVQEDESPSNSLVKTRAKLSSQHPDLFAYSRGKSIFLVSHDLVLSRYTDARTRMVNGDKYFEECDFRIITPKACKDFCFSPDDTIIATLDKSARLKLWDIRAMSDAVLTKRPSSHVLKEPLLSVALSTSSDKASPTSIMFLDRERPYVRGAALRYVLAGFKQNHSFQLWDLAIGKAVQEINLPHNNDVDAICSVAYAPKTCMLVIGHPTRNSIFYLHLSTPSYKLPVMDQARYLTMLAAGDPSLPAPDATAIFGDVREVSFASKGQLRSIDLCRTPAVTPGLPEQDKTLFELYVMHSKGVTCLSVKSEDLGLDADHKNIAPLSGETSGYLKVAPLGFASAAPSEATSKASESGPNNKSASAREQDSAAVQTRAKSAAESPMPVRQKPVPAMTKSDARSEAAVQKPATKAEPATAAEPTTTRKTERAPSPQAAPAKSILINGNHVETPSSSQITGLIEKHFENLYRKVEDDRRAQDIAANARQSAVLELVSSTLTENVERSLNKIVTESVTTKVLPALSSQAISAIDRKLTTELQTTVPRQITTAVTHAIKASLADKNTTRTISQQVMQDLMPVIRKTVTESIASDLVPLVTTIQNGVVQSEARMIGRLEVMEQQQRFNAEHIKTLTGLVTRMADEMSAMVTSQQEMQAEMSAVAVNAVQTQPQPVLGSSGPDVSGAVSSVTLINETVVDDELELIRTMMQTAPEMAMLEWVRSTPNHLSIFDQVIYTYDPRRLPALDTVMILSILCVLLTDEWWACPHTAERLHWTDTMISLLSKTEIAAPELADAVPRVLGKIWRSLSLGHESLSLKVAVAAAGGAGGGGGGGGRATAGIAAAESAGHVAEINEIVRLCARLQDLAPGAAAFGAVAV